MNYAAITGEIGSAIMTLILISAAGAIFEALDADGNGAEFMVGLCAASCILGTLGRLIGLAG